jgi:hypothetical protein
MCSRWALVPWRSCEHGEIGFLEELQGHLLARLFCNFDLVRCIDFSCSNVVRIQTQDCDRGSLEVFQVGFGYWKEL